MIWKRLLLAAAAASVLPVAAARGERVDPTLTQDQANRLSLFHDYGLTAVGTTNSVSVPANVGNAADAAYAAVPGSSGTGLMTSLLGDAASTDATGTGRHFDVTFAPVLAYDSNPESRRLPRASVFVGGDLGVAYLFTDGPDDPIVGTPLRATFAYDVLGGVYEGQTQNADSLQQNVSASVRQTLFDNSIVINATLNDTFTMLHDSGFLDTFDFGATAELFPVSHASVEVGYDYGRLQYFYESVLPAQKADADRSTFIAKAHLYPLSQRRGAVIAEPPDVLTEILEESVRRFTVNYNHVWNVPARQRNRDYQYEANRIGFGLEGLTVPAKVGTKSLGTAGRDVSVDLDYAHEFQEYEYANTESPPILTGKPHGRLHRQDGIDVFTVRGNSRLFDVPHNAGTVAAYVQWDVIHDGSNIVSRHYNDYVIGGGVTYRY